MYTQLLMNWREEMLCSVLGWPYMRPNLKALNTLGTLVSIHMWMCVCVVPSRDFIEVFEGFWVWLTLHQDRTRMLAVQRCWRPGRWSHKRWFPLMVGIEETATLVGWHCCYGRSWKVGGPLLGTCFSDLIACGTLRADDLWTRHWDVLEDNIEMKAKFLTGTPWELGKMFILRENKSVAPSPSCFSSAVQTEAGGKAEGCSAHPQHSRGVVRTWESVPWVALSQRLIFTAHSYFSQGAAEVQARPDKGEKKSRS